MIPHMVLPPGSCASFEKFFGLIQSPGYGHSCASMGGRQAMLCNDAKQIAGLFHGMNRSIRFRANWPDEYLFADANWKTFVVAARAMYAERLADPKTPPADARKMHLALVLEQQASKGPEKDNRHQ